MSKNGGFGRKFVLVSLVVAVLSGIFIGTLKQTSAQTLLFDNSSKAAFTVKWKAAQIGFITLMMNWIFAYVEQKINTAVGLTPTPTPTVTPTSTPTPTPTLTPTPTATPTPTPTPTPT